MQTFQLLAAKTLIPPEIAQVSTQLIWVYNQSETIGIVKQTPGFFNQENTYYANSILQAWVHSHHSGASQLWSQVSYHPWLEQWGELLLWILPTFCGHFAGLSANKQVPSQFNTPQDVSEILQLMLDEVVVPL